MKRGSDICRVSETQGLLIKSPGDLSRSVSRAPFTIPSAGELARGSGGADTYVITTGPKWS